MYSKFFGSRLKIILLLILLLSFIKPYAFAQSSTVEKIDSIKISLDTQIGKEKVQSLNELAWYYKNIDIDTALYFSFLAYSQAQKSHDKATIASSFSSLANTYDALGNLDSAEYYHKEVINIKTTLKDSLGLGSAYNNLGIVYDKMGKFDASLQQYFTALMFYEKHSEDLFDVAMVLGNIGIVYKKQKAYEKVLEYYQKALAIYKQVGSEFGQTVTQGNIGSLLINLGQYEEAIKYSNTALKGYLELGYVRYESYMQRNIAVANDSLHRFNLANKYHLLAIEGHKKHQNKFELAATLNSLTNSYLKQNKYTEALSLAKEALDQAKIIKAIDLEVSAQKNMSLAYAGLENYKQAYINLGIHFKGNDSLFNLEKTRTIEELQTQYETVKKEEQIKLQGYEIDSQKATNDRNTILIVALSIGLILLILIGLLLKNRLVRKQQLTIQQKDINFKEMQISAVIDSQEKERKRFATDLHDGFGQLISILKLNVESIEQQKDKAKRHALFENSVGTLNDMYSELRNICFNLMPQSLVDFGLIPSLKEFADKINASEKVFVEVLTFDMKERLSELQEISLYRIAQEWVNNILKYSDAENVTIQMTKDEAEITLTIEDNGTGFEVAKLTESNGNGWKNMRSRSNLIHAEIELDTTPNIKGNLLTLNMPLIHTQVASAVGQLREDI
jgi:signal transduction histidine kinase